MCRTFRTDVFGLSLSEFILIVGPAHDVIHTDVGTIRNAKPLLALAPDLVVTMMTPFAAREPYKAVALAPFNTWILSMSSGFKSEKPLP